VAAPDLCGEKPTSNHLCYRKLNKKFCERLIVYFPSYGTDRTEDDVSSNSYIVTCVFVAMVTFLPSRCLEQMGEFYLAVALQRYGGAHIDTQTDEEIYEVRR
jgi:hypothetical protein